MKFLTAIILLFANSAVLAGNALEDAINSVIYIVTPTSIGSGFLIDVQNSIFVTNSHVFGSNPCHQTLLFFKNGDRGSCKIILVNDRENDLLVFQADRRFPTHTPLVLSEDTSASVGTEIYTIGHPEMEPFILSKGIISYVRENLLTIDAPISPGNSGGPVIDTNGTVFGVVVAEHKEAHDVNLAIRSCVLLSILRANRIPYISRELDDPEIKTSATAAPEEKKPDQPAPSAVVAVAAETRSSSPAHTSGDSVIASASVPKLIKLQVGLFGGYDYGQPDTEDSVIKDKTFKSRSMGGFRTFIGFRFDHDLKENTAHTVGVYARYSKLSNEAAATDIREQTINTKNGHLITSREIPFSRDIVADRSFVKSEQREAGPAIIFYDWLNLGVGIGEYSITYRKRKPNDT